MLLIFFGCLRSPSVVRTQYHKVVSIIMIRLQVPFTIYTDYLQREIKTNLTLKDMGGWNHPTGQEIACHFSQDHTMVRKFLDFIHKHPKYKVVKYFFYYLDKFSRNSAETKPEL